MEHHSDGARPGNGLLYADAGTNGWVRQLVRAAYDWCARHGVPTLEQHQLLAAGAGVHTGHDWASSRSVGHGLDAVPAAVEFYLRARHWHGFHAVRAALGRGQLFAGCDQLHHYDLQHARAWHDDVQAAALRLVRPGHGVLAPAVDPRARRRHHDVDHRPRLRYLFL